MRILQGLGSRSLACGCFVGLYETYRGETVEIVEERGPRCTNVGHEEGHVTHEPPGSHRSQPEQHVA